MLKQTKLNAKKSENINKSNATKKNLINPKIKTKRTKNTKTIQQFSTHQF